MCVCGEHAYVRVHVRRVVFFPDVRQGKNASRLESAEQIKVVRYRCATRRSNVISGQTEIRASGSKKGE